MFGGLVGASVAASRCGWGGTGRGVEVAEPLAFRIAADLATCDYFGPLSHDARPRHLFLARKALFLRCSYDSPLLAESFRHAASPRFLGHVPGDILVIVCSDGRERGLTQVPTAEYSTSAFSRMIAADNHSTLV
jgi:hypothetical protein